MFQNASRFAASLLLLRTYGICRRGGRFLERTTHRTHCPLKGNASYWTLRVRDRASEDAVWSYLEPLPECPRIKRHYCFDPDKIDRLEIEGETS